MHLHYVLCLKTLRHTRTQKTITALAQLTKSKKQLNLVIISKMMCPEPTVSVTSDPSRDSVVLDERKHLHDASESRLIT